MILLDFHEILVTNLFTYKCDAYQPRCTVLYEFSQWLQVSSFLSNLGAQDKQSPQIKNDEKRGLSCNKLTNFGNIFFTPVELVNARSDEERCRSKSTRTPSSTDPVLFHPLQQTHGRCRDSRRFVLKVKLASKSFNKQAGIWTTFERQIPVYFVELGICG